MSKVKEIVQFLIRKKIIVPVKVISALAKKEKNDIDALYNELQNKNEGEIKKVIEDLCQDKKIESEGTVSIVVNHTAKEVSKSVQDFVSYKEHQCHFFLFLQEH